MWRQPHKDFAKITEKCVRKSLARSDIDNVNKYDDTRNTFLNLYKFLPQLAVGHKLAYIVPSYRYPDVVDPDLTANTALGPLTDGVIPDYASSHTGSLNGTYSYAANTGNSCWSNTAVTVIDPVNSIDWWGYWYPTIAVIDDALKGINGNYYTDPYLMKWNGAGVFQSISDGSWVTKFYSKTTYPIAEPDYIY